MQPRAPLSPFPSLPPNPPSDFEWSLEFSEGSGDDYVIIRRFLRKDATTLVVPEEIEGARVELFYWDALAGCDKLSLVAIPDSAPEDVWSNLRNRPLSLTPTAKPTLRLIDGVLFTADGKTLLSCPTFQKGDYVVPEGVVNVASGAFRECFSLTSVVLPPGLTCVDDAAFEGCCDLTSVVFPDSLRIVDYRAFRFCESLSSIELPDGLEIVGNEAFSDCYSLSSVKFPDALRRIDKKAFENCCSLSSVKFPDSLQTIGESAFRSCRALSSVVLPNGLQRLGEKAFDDCDSLSSIVISDAAPPDVYGSLRSMSPRLAPTDAPTLRLIDGVLFSADGKTLRGYPKSQTGDYVVPSHVATIDDKAFYECRSLTSIVFPNALESIGDAAFARCASLTSIALPKGLRTLGFGAFANCSSLTSVAFPDSLRKIAPKAFAGCNALTDVAFSGDLQSIGDAAFAYCSSLTSVAFPDSLRNIASKAFVGCKALTDVAFSGDLQSIGDEAFSDCDALSSVVFSGSLQSLGKNVFPDDCEIAFPDSFSETICAALPNARLRPTATETPRLRLIDDVLFTADGKTLLRCPRSKSGDYVVPNGVVKIDVNAFAGCSKLTSVALPSDYLSHIDRDAFKRCLSSTAFVIPDSAPDEVWQIFRNFSALRLTPTATPRLRLVDGVLFSADGKTLLYYPPFASGSYVVPEGVETIGARAFYHRYRLSSVKFPDSLQTIEKEAFCFCRALSSVEFPDSLQTIEQEAFSSCDALSSVKLPASLQTLGQAAFRHCDSLSSVEFSNSLQTIGKEAFCFCRALSSVKFPDSLQTIEQEAFSYCDALSSVEFPDSLQTIEQEAFSYCAALSSVKFPPGMQTIAPEAFNGCRNLSTVEFANATASIGPKAFHGSQATAVVPDSASDDFWRPLQGLSFRLTKTETPRLLAVDGVLFSADGKTLLSFPRAKTGVYAVPLEVEHFGDFAFADAFRLNASNAIMSFSDKLKTIGEGAFYGAAIQALELPEGVLSVGEQAFYDCVHLTSVSLPGSLKSLGEEAFGACPSLKTLEIPDNAPYAIWRNLRGTPLTVRRTAAPKLRAVDGVLFNAAGNTLLSYPRYKKGDYVVPDGVVKIATFAFDSGEVKSVAFPNSLRVVSENAFWNCERLKSVAFGDGLERVENSAFNDCHELESIVFGDGNPTLARDAFRLYGTYRFKICAPAGSAVESFARERGYNFEPR